MAAPMSTNTVELGFIEKVDNCRLFSRFFPSKVGGKPAWLELKNLPKHDELICQTCGKPCVFVLQIYAPVPNKDSCFHRSVFVFLCKNTECHKRNNSNSFLVLRSQLSRTNQFYDYEPPNEDEEKPENHPNPEDFETSLCRVCGCLGGKRCSKCHTASYCSREHQTIDWKKGHKMNCGDPGDLGFLFLEFELVTEPENEGDEDQQSDDEKYSKYLESGADEKTQDFKIEELQKMAVKETKEDKTFLAFKKRVDKEPEQVLRHQRGGQPLWVSNDNKPTAEDIPPCSCGSPRQFEFQIMPQLLIHLNVDSVNESIDWGTLLVYTCSNSCDEGPAYHKEFIWKQDVSSHQPDME
ncbi:programmed cell death protein 2-like [Amphiura filiformis]|uniref:programmed cell death protein 2-like n=1 Tax=Amphiura filiformis TaxID=82378 RepID=UPI003B224D5C